ncbi:MAG: hypothetical protein EPO10_13685 [Reyranella sp.]|nr:MAG: hypothetical protein EPO10_13685 [Reyranella sp.]
MPADIPLHPDTRDLYGALLRPPPGTVFDAAVATTYSLDFETALAIPVTLTLFASENRDEMLKSPLTLLEGLERNADRLVIFCDAGRIQAQPQAQSRLCSLLERTIVEVTAPGGGAFHPKLWILRYRSLDPSEPTRLRLLILSRNLTRDRSWDLSLSLDGVVGRSRRSRNRPLIELIQQLPSRSNGPLPAHVPGLIETLSADLPFVDWDVPAPYEEVAFAVNGFGRKVWQPSACNRLAIVSPFCDGATLTMMADLAAGEKPLLVSRSEELVGVPPEILARYDVSVMEENAENEDGEADDESDQASRPLSGLHAKAFIQEIGWETAITVGSGNATRPALITGTNVEVFATLTGKRAKVGKVSSILGPEGFGGILRPFRPDEIPPEQSDQRAAEERIEQARRELVAGNLRLDCSPSSSEDEGPRRWSLRLRATASLPLEGLATAIVWPITRGEAHACDVLAGLRQGLTIEIGQMPLVDVTRFVAFRLVEASGKAQGLFSLGVTIDGLPADRHRAILGWAIESRDAFLRYLRLLLADLGDPFAAQLAAKQAGKKGDWAASLDDQPILEDMLRALTHGPDRLRALGRLMDRLGDSAGNAQDSAHVVPEEFLTLWSAFKTVIDEPEKLDA